MGFGLLGAERIAIRATPNPYDKATIVSIFPALIDEVKHTIQPGRFVIPPGNIDNPSLLIVGPSSWWKETDEGQPMLEIPISSVQIADSVVRDYCNGLLACDMEGAMPGLFYLPGEWTYLDILAKYPQEFDKALARQKNWFSALVKMADALWSRSNGNPLAISDQMRMAAQELQMKDKPWLSDFNTIKLENCPACGVLRNNQFPICQHCHVVIDQLKFKELGLKFAS